VSGLVVTASTLDEGEDAVLECILHEAAHLLNWVRGLKDTTMRGGYHNAQYLTAAEEVGLRWPDDTPRAASKGYASVGLADETRARYADNLAALRRTIPQALPHLTIPESSTKSRQPDRLTMRCKCQPKPRNIRVAQTIAAQGPITCGVCGAAFTVTEA
jgi:predicted SprT family Zn-dependent metalloprotease